MSKMKALITMLVLGSSSAAMAAPSVSFDASAHASWGTPAANVRDHRTTTTSYQPAPSYARSSWISLAQPMTGTVTVRLETRSLINQIRIQSARGSSYISNVVVRFEDGSRQVLTLNRWIDTRNPILQFNLNRTGRVSQLVISASAHGRRSSYQLFGYATRETERPMRPTYQPQPPVYQPPVYQPQGVLLADTVSFAHTDGRRLIDVGASKGPFGTVRFQGVSGTVYIKMIHITFTNGQEQMLGAVNQTLRAGEVFDLKLDGAGRNQIQRISLWTTTDGQPITQATGEFTATAF